VQLITKPLQTQFIGHGDEMRHTTERQKYNKQILKKIIFREKRESEELASGKIKD